MSSLPDINSEIGELLPPSSRYTVLSIYSSAMNDGATDQVDSLEVSFMLTGRTGTFTIETPTVYTNTPDPQADAYLIDEYIMQEADVVDALYAL